MNNTIDVQLFSKMFLAGAQNLENKKEIINELNVFPVPDGDTGTNMTLTIMAAAKAVSGMEESEYSFESLCKTISSETMRGARGNSGVILSQLLRGFTKVVRTAQAIDIPTLTDALTRATETAYRAVMSPKEGTILTVARCISEKAEELSKSCTDMNEFMQELIKEGDVALESTPDLLPVLKEAGVVDSGGTGLMTVIKGAYDAYCGIEIPIHIEAAKGLGIMMHNIPKADIETADIKFGYCTEFIIMLDREFSEQEEQEFKDFLMSIGNSVVCVCTDDLIKVHVHTNDPGKAFSRAVQIGQLDKMKIDNMRLEHTEKLFKDAEKLAAQQAAEDAKKIKVVEPRKPYGFISVSVGDGLSEVFTSLGVDYIISGGQTMNPSTDDFLSAIEKVNADTIYLLPNNGNIIMAANQAAALTKDRKIYVIPTKNIPQGVSALVNFISTSSPEENFETMCSEIQNVKAGSVTYAVRNTQIDGVDIKENDIMGLSDHSILAVGSDINDTALEMISKMVDEDSVLLNVYYGDDISDEAAESFRETLEKEYPDFDVFVQKGGQPIYYYIVSVE